MLFINKAKARKKTLAYLGRHKKIAWQEMLRLIRSHIKYNAKFGNFHTRLFIKDSEKIELIPELEQFLVKRGYYVKATYYEDVVGLIISWQEE